ncbi:MAG: hypothetical protein B6A08_03420 [Sorangiineae bacterium NIC37A_2]|jgi:hypothetical protein|nr:MAG: hypothetical protein B6A08_03420 [Sorangiineae bacterium NIC37A_2]
MEKGAAVAPVVVDPPAARALAQGPAVVLLAVVLLAVEPPAMGPPGVPMVAVGPAAVGPAETASVVKVARRTFPTP